MDNNIRQMLRKEFSRKIELHAHTSPASPCGDAIPEELVKFYLDAGFDGVVLTNHFSRAAFGAISREAAVAAQMADYEQAVKAAEGTGLKIYLGVEARFDEHPNDYLLYGVDAEILGKIYDYLDKGLAAFREEVRLPASVFVQAHPYRNGCEPAPAQYLDGIETFNMHPNHNSRCALAQLYARENGISITTAGSDFHHIKYGHIGNTALRCRELPEDTFALAALLKSGDYIFEIGDKLIL